MKRALNLAQRGLGKVSPNPLRGAVVGINGEVVGRGYYKEFGHKHAEIRAIAATRGKIEGATLYTIMEPCCHDGKILSCVDTLIQAKIKRVVVGVLNPNLEVDGRGRGTNP
jgi:diaminohydroxyphosphoribosylaminopyrimidine deaminase/5-amino-6-(5-phosphoribosylamino)uracil reductase